MRDEATNVCVCPVNEFNRNGVCECVKNYFRGAGSERCCRINEYFDEEKSLCVCNPGFLLSEMRGLCECPAHSQNVKGFCVCEPGYFKDPATGENLI